MCGLLTAAGRFRLTHQRSRVGGVSEGSGKRREEKEGGGCSANLQSFREKKKGGSWEKNRERKEGALWKNVSNAILSHNRAHV